MSVLALCGGTAFSQSQLDAFKYSQTELNGTARYLGMGGAFGALGGDISDEVIICEFDNDFVDVTVATVDDTTGVTDCVCFFS